MTVTLYGFRSCDMVRNAIKWLDANKVEHEFFDYRVKKLDPKTVDGWFARAGWENVFNRNSTTYKELSEAQKQGIDQAKAKAMLLEQTNLIKRPILDTGKDLILGFKPAAYASTFSK